MFFFSKITKDFDFDSDDSHSILIKIGEWLKLKSSELNLAKNKRIVHEYKGSKYYLYFKYNYLTNEVKDIFETEILTLYRFELEDNIYIIQFMESPTPYYLKRDVSNPLFWKAYFILKTSKFKKIQIAFDLNYYIQDISYSFDEATYKILGKSPTKINFIQKNPPPDIDTFLDTLVNKSCSLTQPSSNTCIPYKYCQGCTHKAHYIAHQLMSNGIECEKIFVMGKCTNDEITLSISSDISCLNRQDSEEEPYKVVSCPPSWQFHVGVLIKVGEEKYVFDPTNKDKKLKLDDWLNYLKATKCNKSSAIGKHYILDPNKGNPRFEHCNDIRFEDYNQNIDEVMQILRNGFKIRNN